MHGLMMSALDCTTTFSYTSVQFPARCTLRARSLGSYTLTPSSETHGMDIYHRTPERTLPVNSYGSGLARRPPSRSAGWMCIQGGNETSHSVEMRRRTHVCTHGKSTQLASSARSETSHCSIDPVETHSIQPCSITTGLSAVCHRSFQHLQACPPCAATPAQSSAPICPRRWFIAVHVRSPNPPIHLPPLPGCLFHSLWSAFAINTAGHVAAADCQTPNLRG